MHGEITWSNHSNPPAIHHYSWVDIFYSSLCAINFNLRDQCVHERHYLTIIISPIRNGVSRAGAMVQPPLGLAVNFLDTFALLL